MLQLYLLATPMNQNLKDGTHMRRTGSCVAVTVNVSGDMVLQCRKEDFLNNGTNKQAFINYLSNKLANAGCNVHHDLDYC